MPNLNDRLFSASFFCIFRQISAHTRGILLPLRGKVPLCGGVGEARGGYYTPPPDGLATATPRPKNGAVGILLGYCSDMLSPVIPAQAGIGSIKFISQIS